MILHSLNVYCNIFWPFMNNGGEWRIEFLSRQCPFQFSIANICPKVSQIKFKIWIFLCRFNTRTLAGDKCGDGDSSRRGRIQRTYSIFLSYISKEPISVHMKKGNELNSILYFFTIIEIEFFWKIFRNKDIFVKTKCNCKH